LSNFRTKPRWGNPPWSIDFKSSSVAPPAEVDFAVVGGGFTGLATAAWLRHRNPEKTVALFEALTIGSGASGHTGGMVLAETAAGDLPGLGDVLAGFSDTLRQLNVDCDLNLPGVWEVARKAGLSNSPINWTDSGVLRVNQEVPGGTLDPGMLVSGLARAAQALGAQIFENAPVENIQFQEPLVLSLRGQNVRARKVLLATNAMSLEMSSLAAEGQPKLTLAVATESLTRAQHADLGLESGKPFYTVDFPYLWGRLHPSGSVIFGSGLVGVGDWRELAELDVASGQTSELIARLQTRVQGLHPLLRNVKFAYSWGGPILIAGQWRPVFTHHPQSQHVIVLGAYSGHGVALSVYLGRWAAEAMSDQKALPDWNSSGVGH
jgi:glycine/D-amino acid oxidase-like deaminating enzyme